MLFPKKRYVAAFRRRLVAALIFLVMGIASQTVVAQSADPPYDETFESWIQMRLLHPRTTQQLQRWIAKSGI